MSGALRLLAAALAVAILTWLAGWWAVVVVALVAGALPSRFRLGGGLMAAAGALGWALLLARHALHPAFATLLQRVGGVLQLPGVALLAVALLYAALLGWSGATVGGAIARLWPRGETQPGSRSSSDERHTLPFDTAPARPAAEAQPR
jgi:hypothetical protein